MTGSREELGAALPPRLASKEHGGRWFTSGVSDLLVSLGHTGRRRVVWAHTLNTLQHIITKKLIMCEVNTL